MWALGSLMASRASTGHRTSAGRLFARLPRLKGSDKGQNRLKRAVLRSIRAERARVRPLRPHSVMSQDIVDACLTTSLTDAAAIEAIVSRCGGSVMI